MKDKSVTKHPSASLLVQAPEDELSTENVLMTEHEQQSTETSQTSDDPNRLELKADTVIHMLKNLMSTKIEQQKSSSYPDISTIVKELSTDCVRCEICINYLFSRDGVFTKRDPLLVDDDDGQAIAYHIKKYVVFLILSLTHCNFSVNPRLSVL